jgi:hypothetical protein
MDCLGYGGTDEDDLLGVARMVPGEILGELEASNYPHSYLNCHGTIHLSFQNSSYDISWIHLGRWISESLADLVVDA